MSEPQTLYVTRWILNSTGGRILKVLGYPVAGAEGAAVIASGQLKRQIILGDWFETEEQARQDAKKAIKESIKTTERELARKQALLDALETDPEFVVDQTEVSEAAE